MKEPKDYLNDLERKTGSDYKTAKLLNVNKSTISHIRSRGLISDETAIKVADALGIDRTELLIAAALARSEGEVKSAWIEASKRAGIAASTLLAIGLTTASGNADAASIQELANVQSYQLENLYIMLNRIRRKLGTSIASHLRLFARSQRNDRTKKTRTESKIELLSCAMA